MKKLFFSAVALVAFSSVSMGNSMGIEETNIIETNNEVTCAKKAMAYLDLIDPNNELSSVDAAMFYRGYVDACVGNLANPPRH